MDTAILILFYLLTPALVVWLTEKLSFLNKIGAIILLYLLGIVVGNSGIIPSNAASLQDTLSSALVPLAIPMMLFSCDFKKFSWRNSMLTLLCGIVAVVIMVVCGYLIFKPHLGAEGAKIGGMLSGVYTGGTPNLAALKLALNVSADNYIVIHSFDIVISFLYLIFLMTFGIRLFRRILPYKSKQTISENEAIETSAHPYHGIFRGKELIQVVASLGVSLLIVAISAGLGTLVGQQYFMMTTILALSSLGIAVSFIRPVRRLRHSYDVGMYLVYVFSLVVASMANIQNIDFVGGLWSLGYIAFVIFGSLCLAILFSRLFKIDADTTTIASVALINSPPMVPMITAAMKNRNVLVTGLGVGIIGYAIGNYLGVLIYNLLERL